MIRPWSTPRGWTPRRYGMSLTPEHGEILVRTLLQRDHLGEAMSWLSSPAGVRWVLAPLVSLAILTGAAVAFARDAYAYDELLCPQNDTVCYDMHQVLPVMIVATVDQKTGKKGVVTVNCEIGVAITAKRTWIFGKDEPLARLCDTIGRDE